MAWLGVVGRYTGTSHSIATGPILSHQVILLAIGLVELSDVWHKRVVRVGVCH